MKLPIFDAHCDTAYELYRRNALLGANDCHISLDQMEQLPGCAQFFAFWAAEPAQGETSSGLFRAMYDYFLHQLALFPTRISLCTNAAQAEQTIAEGRVAAFLSIEGAEALDCDPSQLEAAYQMGIRMMTLTWNGANALAGSHLTGGGLTDRGRAFVREAQRLGILIDVSHLSDDAFWNLLDITEAPIVASHSDSRAVWQHSRNLTDDQFREIAQTGGVVGLNLFTKFLGDSPVTLETAVRHTLHWLELGGAQHICLGGDLDGCDSLPVGFEGIRNYPDLADALLSRGVPEQIVRDMMYNNLMKVVKQCSI